MSGNAELVPVLDLGTQSLTGVFPSTKNATVTSGPVELVVCPEGGLLQLRQTYDLSEMYGDNYGYRSGLNNAMVIHLADKARRLTQRVSLSRGDIVLDIGSNDATLLRSYPKLGQRLGGIDPSAAKFRHYYPDDVALKCDFFSSATFKDLFGDPSRAKIVTSIAMFYDLEDPLSFMQEVEGILADDGIWHFEQSYMPAMLEATAYDTVCQEHLEYYGLTQIKWMTDRSGLRILDVELNKVNGGSFAVTVAKESSPYKQNLEAVNALLLKEEQMAFETLQPYAAFRDATFRHRDHLRQLVDGLNATGKKIFGYGASTKGNVLLQFCGFTADDIPCIAEVNQDKFGHYTPGTGIPIVPEEEARKLRPDYFLVLPWHFRSGIIEREKDFLSRGGQLIFPLPHLEAVGR